jgi:hypothetical protein
MNNLNIKIMELLTYLGFGLIVLGALSGLAIYVSTFTGKKNLTALCWLFVSGLIGGSITYNLGKGTLNGIVYISYVLLSLGCISAVTLFLSEIRLFGINRRSILWILFLVCTPVGIIGIYQQEIVRIICHT